MIHVVAGAVFDAAGRVLLAQRPPGSHMAGGWEFPGGKREAGETPLAGLVRELREELGIEVVRATPVIQYRHSYPERDVLLDLWHVDEFGGVPAGVEGQPLKWVPLGELGKSGLLAADLPMIGALLEFRAGMETAAK